ncbi:MAG: HAD family phosphatase [Chitinophagales bacterium]|nr:HAD family phosphatase [Chitinophagales bacterium]MDW8428618.1 HAD family phosphatase [Chitinophagales bacterium]
MIRNIILDYGGVIIDIDYEAPARYLERLQVPQFRALFSAHYQHPLFDAFDRGQITEAAFRNQLRQVLGVPLTDEQIDEAWNSMIVQIRPEKIDLLRRLYAEDYHMFLLSNTNFIHLKFLTKYLLRHYEKPTLEEFFDKVYYSCILGLRKPDPAIFQRVIDENALRPQETLYVDDQLTHVQAAAALGLIAVQYNPATDLEALLRRLIAAHAEQSRQQAVSE